MPLKWHIDVSPSLWYLHSTLGRAERLCRASDPHLRAKKNHYPCVGSEERALGAACQHHLRRGSGLGFSMRFHLNSSAAQQPRYQQSLAAAYGRSPRRGGTWELVENPQFRSGVRIKMLTPQHGAVYPVFLQTALCFSKEVLLRGRNFPELAC